MSEKNSTDRDNTRSMTAKEFLRKLVEKREGGTHRPQQEKMVDLVEDAIVNKKNAIVQAGTGTGKSLGELIPAVVTGKRVVVSTATKQLSEQIVNIDLPDLAKAAQEELGEPLSYHLLKGRDNYLCKRKMADMQSLGERAEEHMSELEMEMAEEEEEEEAPMVPVKDKRAVETQNLMEWGQSTSNGDRSYAPPVSNEIWAQFSSTSAECPGAKSCPFGEECFAEYARYKAKAAKIAVVNHSISGLDMVSNGGLLGDRDVFIFDEVHELDNYLSSAWGDELTSRKFVNLNKEIKTAFEASSKIVADYSDTLFKLSEDLGDFLGSLKENMRLTPENMPKELTAILDEAYTTLTKLSQEVVREGKKMAEGDARLRVEAYAGTVDSALGSVVLLRDDDPEIVRWIEIGEKRGSIKAAPLRVGPMLQEFLTKREATMVATSATISVGGGFSIPAHNLGMDEEDAPEYTADDVGTPFDYKKQGMLYVPNPDAFPAPIGKDRFEHKEAVKEEALELVKASGGRALFLSSTFSGAKDTGAYLRKHLEREGIRVLIQGEAPNQQLTDEFVLDETSVLCATMGMWHGLNAPGKTCQLVMIDKIPFTPKGDPLITARQEYSTSQGRNGFMEVYVAEAATKLSQGAGRLIRTEEDKGVIAIFDTRLLTKSYGKALIKGLPPSNRFADLEVVKQALSRLSK